ncbi:MAG: glycine cleavage system aminomethyltransferase GcvT [Chlorobi bacterium]|nr:glycine cleavage system aminomethyltransferase GcvT [Chlorobiota bacterium]
MKKTPFIDIHRNLGAKIIPFAGFQMPLEYSGIQDEHITVREKLGVFDVSHMGEIWVTGPKAMPFLQYVTSNDVSVLFDGKVQYSCLPNGRGGIVDDLLVYRLDEGKYLLVVNAYNTEKDFNWLCEQGKPFDLVVGEELLNASDRYGQLAVQGPLALKAMQKLTNISVVDMPYYMVKKISFAGIDDVIFSTTGYTGAGGCEIYMPAEKGPEIWQAVMNAGKEYGIKPIGLGARDTLRLEMGFCLYGNDIDDTTSPIEAGLDWITKFTDDKDFIDKDFLLKQKEEGTDKRLKGFIMIDRGIPRQHYNLVDVEGNRIGEVTSGSVSPMLKKGIGMGYLKKGFWKTGTEIFVEVRNKLLKAVIVNFPFYHPETDK